MTSQVQEYNNKIYQYKYQFLVCTIYNMRGRIVSDIPSLDLYHIFQYSAVFQLRGLGPRGTLLTLAFISPVIVTSY